MSSLRIELFNNTLLLIIQYRGSLSICVHTGTQKLTVCTCRSEHIQLHSSGEPSTADYTRVGRQCATLSFKKQIKKQQTSTRGFVKETQGLLKWLFRAMCPAFQGADSSVIFLLLTHGPALSVV